MILLDLKDSRPIYEEKKLEKLAREAKTIGILREEFVTLAGLAYDRGQVKREDKA